MNEHTLSPWNVASAAILIGGGLVVAMPQHVLGILQLVLVTITAAMGIYALAVNVPPTGWMSPFKWMSPFGPTPERLAPGHSDELEVIRSQLSGRRQPVGGAPPMPAETLHLLKPLIAAELGLRAGDRAYPDAVRGRVSPLTWAILTSDPTSRPPWFRTLPPNEHQVSEVVHLVLDDLERHAATAGDPFATLDSIPTRPT